MLQRSTVVMVSDAPMLHGQSLDPYLLVPRLTRPAPVDLRTDDTLQRDFLIPLGVIDGLLAGYPNSIYDQELAGWNRQDFAIDNKAAGDETKRQMTESLWMNF